MAIWATDSGKTFPPAPEGLHRAVCVDVVDLGELDSPWGKKRQIELRWQLEVLEPFTDEDGQEQVKEIRREDGKRFLVPRRYNPSTNEKSNLTKHLVSWRGKPFTDEERLKFDVEIVIGKNCQLQIVHKLKEGGGVYSNIQAIVKAPRGVDPLEAEEYVRQQDRREDNAGDGGSDDDLPF